MTPPAEIVAWSLEQDAAGKRDAMGYPFTSWLVARYHPDGRAMRDDHGRQIFENQAEFLIRANQKPTMNEIELKCNGCAWGLICPKRSECVHHQAHQAVAEAKRPRQYSIHDSCAGWSLFACASSEDLDRFEPIAAPVTTTLQPAIGQTMSLF